MKKFLVCFVVFIAVSLVASGFFFKYYPEHVAREVENYTEDNKRVDAGKEVWIVGPEFAVIINDEAMQFVIEDLEAIENAFQKSNQIVEIARGFKAEAEGLRKEIGQIKTEEQIKSATEKAEEFFSRYDPFADYCIALYGAMKEEKHKRVKPEIKAETCTKET